MAMSILERDFLVLSCILSLHYLGISPIQALIYTAILYGCSAPVLIAIILHISNNKHIIGEHINTPLMNYVGYVSLIFITLASIVLLYLRL